MTSETQYRDDEAKQILQRAMELQLHQQEGAFDRAQLTEMARELGISGDALAAAEKQWLAEGNSREEQVVRDTERQAFERERRTGYLAHLIVFIIVNLFLVFLSISSGNFWFIFPLLGWGLGLVAHTWAVRQHEGEQYERQLEQWRGRRRTGISPQLRRDQ